MYSHALQPRERDKWSVVMVRRVSSSGGRIQGQICRSFSEKKKNGKEQIVASRCYLEEIISHCYNISNINECDSIGEKQEI